MNQELQRCPPGSGIDGDDGEEELYDAKLVGEFRETVLSKQSRADALLNSQSSACKDLLRLKPDSIPAWSRGGGHKICLVPMELLAFDDFWEREEQFSSVIDTWYIEHTLGHTQHWSTKNSAWTLSRDGKQKWSWIDREVGKDLGRVRRGNEYDQNTSCEILK